MKITAVIGAQFGDEGKGLMTDYFSDHNSTVILFNGGAQRGHTVVTPGGHRHVFHHFGSGTYSGAITYLSRHFIVNPIVFATEYEKLSKIQPRVIVDPRCPITTPYDMMLNELAELSRGNHKHGSCGYGINETVERSNIRPLTVNDDITLDKLMEIVSEWVPARLKALGIETYPDVYNNYFHSKEIAKKYLDEVAFFKSKCVITQPKSFDNVVFEGAQGLRLHQKHLSPTNPHVTRSNTGMENVMEIAEELGLRDVIETVYVTRCYVTRHGAGPLPNESEKPFAGIVDETNIPNSFQGSIRFARFDLEDFVMSITNDHHDKISVAVTCLDQADDVIQIGPQTFCKKNELSTIISRAYSDVSGLYESYGPQSASVIKK